ncbi:MAG: adenylosuccinate lyase [Oscillospiraceae bacterium]|nr:adenylosuccinate lyase [Candidatus Limimonas coprohippi]
MSEIYENPLCRRYASKEMQRIFSDDVKFSTWRRLWVALAESEKELGLSITDEQIEEMKAHISTINYDIANAREKEVRHDVMAHIYAFGMDCPKAKPIIHLGATSCYVGDNADVIIQKEALLRIRSLLLRAISALADFAEENKAVETLAYTHFQAAQPTTLGKRACLWMQDLLMDLEYLDFVLANMKLLGCKGTTGTGASFLELFDGDSNKVKLLEQKIAEKMGFAACYPVSGQTYTRKADYYLLSSLSGIAQSVQKFSGDIRLLSHLKEVDEPFEAGQVGSSAMAYKRNPMRSERMSSLARFVIADSINPAMTAGTQWLERTLDDSANRRISIPEAFLAVDGILTLYINVISGLTVYPQVMKKHMDEELPFMATENILMECVKRGGDRQSLHEAIREHSVAAGKEVKLYGKVNDLLDRIANDERFGLTRADIDEIIDGSNLCGMAKEQTESFVRDVRDILNNNKDAFNKDEVASINV